MESANEGDKVSGQIGVKPKEPPLTCVVKVPLECSESQLTRFQALVEEGGEVDRSRLSDRIRRAIALAFLLDDQTVVGVAGLKRPTAQYRAKIIASSGAPLLAKTFPYELGWVYISPIARHRHGTPLLVNALLAHQKGSFVYATSAADKLTMHYWLEQAGLHRVGKSYTSGEREIYVFAGPDMKGKLEE